MRVTWVAAGLVVVLGCSNSYDFRMDTTLNDMLYRKRLDDNLIPAPTTGKLQELVIFVRPPKDMHQAKEFLLPPPEPGKFDLETSFIEEASGQGDALPTPENPTPTEPAKSADAKKQSLHMLARVKRPKNPNAKTKVAEPTNRADFNSDVLALLNASFAPPAPVTLDKFKETSKKTNKFKQYSFAVGNKNIQVYLQGTKTDPYEVALVFEYPSSEYNSLSSKIELCLESFAVGNRAKRAFTGVVGDEQSAEGAGTTPTAF